MDQRIEAFLADVLAFAGEDLDAVREGVRVALASCEALFRVREPNNRRALEARAEPSSTGRCVELFERGSQAAGDRQRRGSCQSRNGDRTDCVGLGDVQHGPTRQRLQGKKLLNAP
jgi:hypothetical protein